ncbi:MAG: glycerate kinase, partial [Mycobacteriales bacterium]
MRVLLAPDCFAGTLSADQAAQALAAGWRGVRPHDELVLLPMSDGGPGFLDALPGTRVTALVEDPLARPVLASFHLDGTTAYVESAQAAGLHLLDPADRDPTVTTTYGVGQLVAAAVGAGASRVVVGLGGTATNDGGAGLLAALGVQRADVAGARLAPGGLALASAARLAGDPLRVDLVAATDVDNPLLGPGGASRVFGPQKGASAEQVAALDAALAHWADLLEAHLGVAARDLPGAGAAGGLGFALLAL